MNQNATPSRPFEDNLRFTVLGKLTSSVTSEVLLAAREGTRGREALVALKRMRGAAGQRSAFALLSHLRAVAGVAHPHVVRLYSYFRKEKDIVAVMEYVDGDSLAYLMASLRRAGERIPLPIWGRIALQLCGAVSAFSCGEPSAGPSYGRLCPEHVLLDSRGYLKLIGAVSAMQAQPIAVRMETATLPYRAPDVFRHSSPDARAEVYSLAHVLWTLLADRPPFVGLGQLTTPEIVDKVLYQKLPSLASLHLNVPAEVDEILAWASTKQRDARCPTAAALSEAIRGCSSSFGGLATVAETGEWYSDFLGERQQTRAAFESKALTRLSTIPPIPAPYSQIARARA